jgi:hypothetical protein
MEENPWWVKPAFIGVVAIGGAIAYAMLTRGQATPQPTAEQIEAQRRQQRAETILSQVHLEQAQPLIILAVPAMVGLGAFLLWKKGQEESSRWSDEW